MCVRPLQLYFKRSTRVNPCTCARVCMQKKFQTRLTTHESREDPCVEKSVIVCTTNSCIAVIGRNASLKPMEIQKSFPLFASSKKGSTGECGDSPFDFVCECTKSKRFGNGCASQPPGYIHALYRSLMPPLSVPLVHL